jgi:hypothetical protein
MEELLATQGLKHPNPKDKFARKYRILGPSKSSFLKLLE